MKINLQYFAKQPADPNGGSKPVKPTQPTKPTKTKAKPTNQGAGKPKKQPKTYTQAEVNKIAKESINDKLDQWQSDKKDAVAKAVAEQKKKDNMSITELKAYNKKVHQQKVEKLVAENKQYKHQAVVNKAMKATEDLLAKAKIPNSTKMVKFVFDTDPQARQQKVDTLKAYLSEYAKGIKTEALKGKKEPQTGTGNAGMISAYTKNEKPLDPFTKAFMDQQANK